MFGLPIQESHLAYWGARAIYKGDAVIDLLPDRQSCDGNDELRRGLCQWLNVRGLDLLREQLRLKHIGTDSAEVIEVQEFQFLLRATPNRSYGYLYIGAAVLPIEAEASIQNEKNMFTKTEKVLTVNGKKFLWAVPWDIPVIGTHGRIPVNGIGPATVIGYSTAKQDDMLVICPVCRLEKAPDWWVNQQYNDAVEKAKEKGKKRPLKTVFKANLPPCPVYDCDFRPDGCGH